MIRIALPLWMGNRGFNERLSKERVGTVTSSTCYQIGLGCTKDQGCNMDDSSRNRQRNRFPREYLENIW